MPWVGVDFVVFDLVEDEGVAVGFVGDFGVDVVWGKGEVLEGEVAVDGACLLDWGIEDVDGVGDVGFLVGASEELGGEEGGECGEL